MPPHAAHSMPSQQSHIASPCKLCKKIFLAFHKVCCVSLSLATPFHILYRTPFYILHCTPFYILHSTPFYILHRPPFYILDCTPFNILHCTPFYILRHTPFYIGGFLHFTMQYTKNCQHLHNPLAHIYCCNREKYITVRHQEKSGLIWRTI